ncbi:uncharacterized protein LOC134250585 [Saccostrea cucullata]|uniref:uncharacterized protein LOC134250585 n=1 Tax=Saccostrea cuccullata TaxID=36930 RepID=UPI002ED1857E
MQKRGIEVVTERVACLEKRPCDRSNILDNTTAVLQTQKTRSVYIRTSAVDKIRKKLEENKILILRGKAGCGKTTTDYQVMLELSEESSEPPYDPAIIHSPDEWNKVINPYQRHIVLLDDFMGSSNLDRDALDKWKSNFDAIIACATNGQVLSLIGLRRNILDEAEKYETKGFLTTSQ